MKPIFIFSLPRSGSTLLQRMIAVSDDVATSPESWYMLPLISHDQSESIYSVYSSRHADVASKEFIDNYIGDEEHNKLLANYYNSVFSAASSGKKYFLEKTPRNTFYIHKINLIFGDDAHYIVLLRNPMAIALSMIQTWGAGANNLYSFKQDFEIGLDRLSEVVGDARFHVVTYEKLVAGDLQGVARLLDIDIDENSPLEVLAGKMGDPTGQLKYKRVEEKRAAAWEGQINTLCKVHILRRLMRQIGRERYTKLGYSFEVDYAKARKISKYSFRAELKDFWRLVYGAFYTRIQPFILLDVLCGKLKYTLR